MTWPLTEQTYGDEEKQAMIDVINGVQLTMGPRVKEFEQAFSEYIGSKYSVMVNSGSSANLLAMATLANSKYSRGLKPGDYVAVPNLCWSTSVFPIIQMGLVPLFIDINPRTLNMDMDLLEKAIMKHPDKLKAVVTVHILGNSPDMNRLMELKNKHGLIMLEDTCESLGSRYNGRSLGTFGECGTYSFFYSHHITTIEGGMVVTDSKEIYELLKCLRAHGWTRNLDGHNDTFSTRYQFINLGYNLRPMEIQAAMGLVQLKKLEQLNTNRRHNYSAIIEKLIQLDTDGTYCTIQAQPLCDPAWFAIPLLVNNRDQVVDRLDKLGVATRPVVTGNFVRQPVFKGLDVLVNNAPCADFIHDHGFYIGLPVRKLNDSDINYIVNLLLKATAEH